jgi:AcrR family transcriptional regulator
VPPTPAPARRRDADRTRAALLAAAERRFARDGYAATTVRDIAADAGVNVALISRYFDGKAGLFEACLQAATAEMSRAAGGVPDLAGAVESLVALTAGPGGEAGGHDVLGLFLRSSGDAHAERARTGALRSFGQGLAGLAGWSPGDAGDLLLRGQLVVAAAMGIRVLRAVGGPEPLASASAAELAGPLRDLVAALLGAPAAQPPGTGSTGTPAATAISR